MAANQKHETHAASAPPADGAAGAVPKKKRKLVPVLILAGLMGIEGVGVFFVTKMFSGGQPASAEGAEFGDTADENAETDARNSAGGQMRDKKSPANNGPSEIDITECRLNNRTSGKLITLKMRVSALVTSADAEKAKALVEANKARINDRVNVVVRSATPQELNEPGLETIKRRLKQEFARVLGDEKLISEVLIPEMMQSGSGL